jgi:hypothetical protein
MTYQTIDDDAQPASAPERTWPKALALIVGASLAGFAIGSVGSTGGLRLPQVLNLVAIDWGCGSFQENSPYMPIEKSVEAGGFEMKITVMSNGFPTESVGKPTGSNEITISDNTDRIYVHLTPTESFQGTFDGFQISGGNPRITAPGTPSAVSEFLTGVCTPDQNMVPVVSIPEIDLNIPRSIGDVYYFCDDFVPSCPTVSSVKTGVVAATDETGAKMGLLSAYNIQLTNPEVCKCDEGGSGGGDDKKKKSDAASSISALAGAIVGLLAAAAML